MESEFPMLMSLEFQVIKENVQITKYGIPIIDIRYLDEDVGFICTRNSIFEGISFFTTFSIQYLGVGFEQVFYSVGEAINHISEAVFLRELDSISHSGEPNLPTHAIVLN